MLGGAGSTRPSKNVRRLGACDGIGLRGDLQAFWQLDAAERTPHGTDLRPDGTICRVRCDHISDKELRREQL